MNERAARGAETRETLLRAALDVFVRRGFARATTREIAAAAGVAEGTIYRHFDDKHALFAEVLFSLLTEADGGLGAFLELAGTGSVRENLAHLFAVLGELQQRLSPLMASLWADQELAGRVAARAAELAPEGFVPPGPVGVVAAYVRAEQELGRVRGDVDPLAAAGVIVSVPLAAGMTGSLGAAPETAAEFPRPEAFPAPGGGALDVLVRGLAPDEGRDR